MTKLRYNAQPHKILDLIFHKVMRVDEVLERGKIYDIPKELVDKCLETGFFEYVQEKKTPVKVEKKEEEKE